MSRHCVEIERLFPTYTASLSYESAEQVQRLEEERRNTDLRREKAKDAFGREKALRDAVEKKRQDLAVAQLAEHNEEMERNARRNELVATSKKVDEILINEAAKSGEEARAKILKKSAMEREEIIKNLRGNLLGSAVVGSGGGGEGELRKMEEDLREMEEEGRASSKWLTTQLAAAASTPGRLKLPMGEGGKGGGIVVGGGEDRDISPSRNSPNKNSPNKTVGEEIEADVTALGMRREYYDFKRSSGRWRGRGLVEKIRSFNSLKALVGKGTVGDGVFSEPDNGRMTRMVEEVAAGRLGEGGEWGRDEILCAIR